MKKRYNASKKVLLASAMSLFVSACVSTDVRKDESHILFDARNSEVISDLENFESSISLSFISNKHSGETGYTETSPPMPLLASPFAIYSIDDVRYRLVLKCKTQIESFVEKSGNFDDLNLFISDKGNAKIIYNKKIVLEGENCPQIKSIILGKGYKNRYWAGKIKSLVVNGRKISNL